MPVLPSYDASEKLDTAKMPTVDFVTSAQNAAAQQGKMIQGIGSEIMQVANRWQQMEEQREQFSTRANLDRWQQTIEQEDNEALTKMPENGQGFTEGRVRNFDQRANEFLQTAPLRLRGEYAERTSMLRERMANDYAAKETAQLAKFSVSEVSTAYEKSKIALINNPNELDLRKADVADRIRTAPGIPERSKPALLKQYSRDLEDAAAGKLHEADPEGMARLGGIRYDGAARSRGDEATAMSFFTGRGWSKEQAAGLVGNLIHESRLDTGARNPGDGRDGSDSIGIAQWNAGRAKALREFAAARGKPVTSFQVQLEFVDHELRTTEGKAGERLRNARTASEAAAAIVEAYERPKGSDRGAENALGWAERRGHAERLSSGRVQVASLGNTATDASQPAPTPDPRFSNLTADDWQRLIKGAEANRARQIKAEHDAMKDAEAVTETRRKSYIDQLQYNASKGKVVEEDLDVEWQRGTFKSFEEYNGVKKQIVDAEAGSLAYNRGIDKLQQPSPIWDPTSKEDKDSMSAIDLRTGVVDGLAKNNPDAGQSVAARFASTGMISKEVKGVFEGIIRGGTPQQLEYGMSTLDTMYRRNPNAFNEAFSADTVKALAAWQSRVDRDAGAFREQLKRATDPATAKARKEAETEGRAVVNKMSDKDIVKIFDETWRPGDTPGAPMGTRDVPGMRVLREEYSELYAEGFASSDGNAAAAEKFANDRIKQTWAVSPSSGGKLVKHAPETLPTSIFPPVGGTRDWMTKQVQDAVRRTGGAVDNPDLADPNAGPGVARYSLVATPQTRAEIDALRRGDTLPGGRKSPAWILVFEDPKSGELKTPGAFYFDMDAVAAERQAHIADLAKRTASFGQMTNSGISGGTALSPLTNARTALGSLNEAANLARLGTTTAMARDRADEIDGAERRRDIRRERALNP